MDEIHKDIDEPVSLELLLDNDDDTGTDKQPRLSFFYDSSAIKQNPNKERILDEVDRIEQLITSNLQKINESLILSNNLISNKIIPKLEMFNKNSNTIYNNINHIKEFFENAANVNILTKKDVESHQLDYKEDKINNSYNEKNDNGHDNNSNLIENTSNPHSISFDKDQNMPNHSNDTDEINDKIPVTSDISEFKNIKIRYKQNLGSDNKEQTSTTITNFNSFPAYLRDDLDSSSTFFKGVEVGIDAESTGKQSIQGASDKESKKGKEIINYEEEQEEENFTNKYVKNIMSGYESPPWEEPPILQSSKLGKKRKRKDDKIYGNNGGKITMNDEFTIDSDSDKNSYEEEEDISIRFPASPKYGAGGKLLRTDKGRQIALDFARSEMIKNHPILSLQNAESTVRNVDLTLLRTETKMDEENPFQETAEL
jgi:hypothetical protein